MPVYREVLRIGLGAVPLDVGFSPRGKHFFCSLSTGQIFVWDFHPLSHSEFIISLEGSEGEVYACISPIGEYLVSASSQGDVLIWDLKDFKATKIEKFCEGITSFSISSDGSLIAFSESFGTNRVFIYSVEERRIICEAKGFNDLIFSVKFSNDNENIFCGVDSGKLFKYSIRKAKIVNKIRAHTSALLAIEIIPRYNYVISGSEDGLIRVWDMDDLRVIKILNRMNNLPVNTLSINPVDFSLLAGFYDIDTYQGKLEIWDTIEAKRIILINNLFGITSVKANFDGRFFIFGTVDRIITIASYF